MDPVAITGIGSYLPRRSLETWELPALDKPYPPEAIERLGVRRRGLADEEETIPEMAAAAARVALERAGRTADEMDFIVLANWTQRRYLPDLAARVQALLGARKAFAFDVATACAGFATGTLVARGLLATTCQRGLVIASETTSHRARPHSKATVIFGDGAGAWVLERGTTEGPHLLDVELLTDGEQFDAMTIDAHGHVITHIDQKQLQHLATDSFIRASQAVLGRQGLTLDDVDWIVPHSGTAGIQALLIDVLKVDPEKVLVNFPTVGNLSSAAIPVALDAFQSEGPIRPGDLILSPTTGSGWYAAALLYRV